MPDFSDLDARFWAKVDRSGNCWEWTAFRNPKGYGMFRIRPRESMWLAHRVAYLLTAGVDPGSAEIDHACRNRGCVNPAHLRLATRKQNCENKADGPLRGVTKRGHRWRARIKHGGRDIHVGTFDTPEDAAEAARLARIRYFTHNVEDREVAS